MKLAIAVRSLETGQIRRGELTNERRGEPELFLEGDSAPADRTWFEFLVLPIPQSAYRKHAVARIEIVFRTEPAAMRFLLGSGFEFEWLATADELELRLAVVAARERGAL